MLGNFFIIVAIVSCVLSIIFYYKSIQKEKFLLFARFSYYSLTFFTICASVYLLYLILTHQYQFNYVFEYSSNELTLGLLISSFFAGQEGSFLLWTLFASILGLFIIKSISKYEGYEERVMLVFSFTVLFLLVMINPLFKNPFTLLWSESVFVNVNHLNPYYLNVPFIQNNLFFDSNSTNYYLEINSQLINYLDNNNLYLDNLVINGNGLNPLLQNFWMQIHPPILFGGFALAGVIYSLTIGITLKNKFIALIKIIRPWLLTFLFVLGIGLITGAYWSYGVLGWGGYWGWDPVENSSLIPWLIGIAALHILIIKKSGSENENILLKTCVFLLISIYITVIYSTFLTRSGVLSQASVHSFVSSENIVYLFLLFFLLLFLFGSIFIFIRRLGSVKTHLINSINFFSRNGLILIGTIFLLISTLIIFIGTSAPILGISVDTKFYDKMNLPLIILISIICGISLYLKWHSSSKNYLYKKILLPFFLSAILTTILSFIVNFINVNVIIFLFSSVFLVITNFHWLLKSLRNLSSRIDVSFSHIGLGLFLLGVLATGFYTKDFNVNLKKDKEVGLLDYKIKFSGVEQIEDTEKYKLNVEIKRKDALIIASPTIYFNEFANDFYIEPDVISELAQDIYIAPISYDNGEKQEEIKYLTLLKNETKEFQGMQIKFVSFQFPSNSQQSMMNSDSIVIGVEIKIHFKKNTYSITPIYTSKVGRKESKPVIIEDLNSSFSIIELDASGKIILGISDLSKAGIIKDEQLLVEISFKPFIILIWSGAGLILAGFIYSAIKKYNSI